MPLLHRAGRDREQAAAAINSADRDRGGPEPSDCFPAAAAQGRTFPGAAAAASLGGDELPAQLGQAGLQQPQVVRRGLVLLRPGHLQEQPSPQRRHRPRRAGAASPRLTAPPPPHGTAPLRPLACPAPGAERAEARGVTSASISAILANVPLMAAAAGPGAARESPHRRRSSSPRRQRAGAPRLLALTEGNSRERTVGGKEPAARAGGTEAAGGDAAPPGGTAEAAPGAAEPAAGAV